MNEGKWITLKDGRKILLKPKSVETKNTNEYMNSKLRKEYTKKDIKTLKSNITGIRGYELNGIYLMKHYGQGVRGNDYGWIINKKEDNSLHFSNDYTKAFDNGIAENVPNYREGINRLIELANKKGGK